MISKSGIFNLLRSDTVRVSKITDVYLEMPLSLHSKNDCIEFISAHSNYNRGAISASQQGRGRVFSRVGRNHVVSVR